MTDATQDRAALEDRLAEVIRKGVRKSYGIARKAGNLYTDDELRREHQAKVAARDVVEFLRSEYGLVVDANGEVHYER